MKKLENDRPDHICIMRERMAEGDTKFALLDNKLAQMNEKIDNIELEMVKINTGIESIKEIMINMKFEFTEAKTQAIEDMKLRSNEHFASKTEFDLIRKLVYGAATLILVAVVTAMILSTGIKH